MSRKPTPQDRLSKAETEYNQARARLLDAKAQVKKVARTEKRRLDTQRKVLAGAWVLSVIQHDAEFKARAVAGLDKFLTRDIDRRAFSELIKG